ncbi:acetyl-CoA hydrolase [Sphingomonas histidinilytica]|uniref:acetyl-CoA hydrolase/transferase family protein n=1 Tax=Rhizorhabdus histidinilytica TaxID=439228 RepID=UPI001ADB5723|nr:acetyl-CoA hydrolase/transferase C-terminal domain-containing protein [Rhizorhabdus histidinilytica]MBO9376711.1 acetyl-CoA hydrolase [Rhizorhabdus histidinilytica]
MPIADLLDRFRPGASVYLPGATGESLALAQALAADPDRLRGVEVTSCLLPGMNGVDYAGLAPDARLTVFMLPAATRKSFAQGRVRLLPLAYSAIARHIAAAAFDVAIAHVAPPDAGGRASFGIAADFSPIAWNAARQRIAIVNPHMPSMRRGSSIALAEADLVVELDGPLVEVAPARPDATARAIAGRVAALIPHGAAVQVGIGGAPAALWAALGDHRGLRLRSGLASEELLALADRGALASDGHVAGIAAGSEGFYRTLADRDLIRFADTRETHDAGRIGREERFFAANSALEVDLFGQVNLEWQGGRPVSGAGGAPDFAAAGIGSPGGRSITMLPATAKGGTISRIVARLSSPSVSLPRNLADVVVTEHGVADLRHASLDARAEALIAIADPTMRDVLAEQWRSLRTAMA